MIWIRDILKPLIKVSAGNIPKRATKWYIPEEEGEINIAWFLYEFVVLDIPIKHVHEPGKCQGHVFQAPETPGG